MITPTLDQRLALRTRPDGIAVMRQRWSKLLFLHWRIDPAILSAKLPPGLHLDLNDGEAWIGIVPFFMGRIRPVGLPPVPGLSWFLELNVRTYVHDEHGIPGVWFFSFDCNQPLAVEVARSRFHLPYEHAEMSAAANGDTVHYQCRREGHADTAKFDYEPDGAPSPAEPGTLDFFLAERYLLYSSSPDGRLFTGRVHHRPYLLTPAKCDQWSTAPATWDGLQLPSNPAESTLFVDHIDVSVFPLRAHPK